MKNIRQRVTIIAEAGVNHNGDLNTAFALIDAAAAAGADYVKFQTFKAEKLVSATAPKAAYQSANVTGTDTTQFSMLKKLELSHEDHLALMDHCRKKNIRFLSTAFDVEGVQYLAQLGMDLLKIPSGEITNYPYLVAVAACNKPVVLSTGMCTMADIEAAIDVLERHGCPRKQITVLHCNTEYPTPMEDVNLDAMNDIAEKLGVQTGYSDHTLGIEVPVAAVALGAVVIEKHFTLDKGMEGPDHKASLEPDELIAMVRSIRNIEKALAGTGTKQPGNSELKNMHIARKSLHLQRGLEQGTVLRDDMLIALRPGDGISPMEWNKVIGSTLKVNAPAGAKLTWEDLV